MNHLERVWPTFRSIIWKLYKILTLFSFFAYIGMWLSEVFLQDPSYYIRWPDLFWYPLSIAMPLLVLFGLCILPFMTKGWVRLAPIVLLPAYVFLELLLFYYEGRFGRFPHDEITLSDGRVYILTRSDASAGVMIWVRQGGLVWSELIPSLKDSIVYGYSNELRLVTDQDNKYLLIQRDGIWTDCILLENNKLCPNTENIPEPDDNQAWLSRSKLITSLVNMEL